jgi:hypothetical protein
MKGRQNGGVHMPRQPNRIPFDYAQVEQPACYLLRVSIQIGVAPLPLPVVHGEAGGIQRERSG